MDVEMAAKAEQLFDRLEECGPDYLNGIINELRAIFQPIIDNEYNKQKSKKYLNKYSYHKREPKSLAQQIVGNLNSAISLYEEAYENLERTQQCQADILHAMELLQLSDDSLLKLTKQLKEVRNFRREAKDYTETILPLYEIACKFKNNGITKQLSQVAGEIHKIQERKERRTYHPKALEELTGEFNVYNNRELTKV